MNDLPIGVFDSGVGGLTVLRALAEKWPHEKFLYLADTARLPYGAKSPATIEQYLIENMQFLLKSGVKAIVVACNSASTILLAKKIPSPVPVFNVIQPGSETAASLTKNGRIGIMGTRATVNSEAYVRLLKGLNSELKITQQACPLLVPLIEENWIHNPLTNMVLYRYLQSILKESVDVLVMGCTHYPILKPAIQKVVGPEIQLVDASIGLVKELAPVILSNPVVQSGPVILSEAKDLSAKGEIKIACTDLTPHLKTLITQILTPFEPKSIEIVHL